MDVSEQAIMDVLAQRLGVSVVNLCASLSASQEDLSVCLERLKRAGRIRTARSACAGSCSACVACPGDHKDPEGFTPDTVVISLERALHADS